MTDTGIWCGQVEITSNSSITVGGWLCPITTGSYFMWSKTASQSLVSVVASCMSTSLSATVTASVSSAGVLTLSCATPFAIDWGSETDIRDMLGYTGNLTSATSHVATNQLSYTWIPSLQCDGSGTRAPYSSLGIPVSMAAQVIGADGTVWTQRIGTRTVQEVQYQFITYANTWSTYGFKDLWDNILSDGTPVIWNPLWPTTTTIEWEYVHKLEDNRSADISRQIAGADTRWKIKLELLGVE